MSGKDVVFIVGMGRSGTSALTRVLSLCGCSVPELLVEAKEVNAKGAWEPVESWKLNNEFFFKNGTMAYDPSLRLQEEVCADRNTIENYVEKIRCFLARCPSASPLLIKDLGITEVMEHWFEAARRAGFSVKVAVAVRHPQEVFLSWKSMSGASLEITNARWLKFSLLAERRSRGGPRVFVEYSNLLDDWQAEITRVSDALSIDLKPNAISIKEFLTHDLHRQRYSGPITETFGYPWLTRAYAILSGASRGEPVNLQALDEIYDVYRVNERAFRIARDEFLNWFDRLDQKTLQEMIDKLPLMRAGRDF